MALPQFLLLRMQQIVRGAPNGRKPRHGWVWSSWNETHFSDIFIVPRLTGIRGPFRNNAIAPSIVGEEKVSRTLIKILKSYIIVL